MFTTTSSSAGFGSGKSTYSSFDGAVRRSAFMGSHLAKRGRLARCKRTLRRDMLIIQRSRSSQRSQRLRHGEFHRRVNKPASPENKGFVQMGESHWASNASFRVSVRTQR
jgi:hypothetical protein